MKIKLRIHLLATLAWLGIVIVAAVGINNSLEDSQVLSDITDSRMLKTRALLTAEGQIYNEIMSINEILHLETLPVAERIPRYQAILSSKQEADKELKQALDTYAKLPRLPEADTLFAEIQNNYTEWAQVIVTNTTRELVQVLANPTDENMHNTFIRIQQSIETVRSKTVAINELLNQLLALDAKTVAAVVADNEHTSQNALIIQIVVSAVLILSAIILGISTLKSVVAPTIKVRDAVQQIARDNNLKLRVDYKSSDEVGEMVSAFNSMMDQLQTSFQNIQKRMGEVNTAVESLSTAAQQVATGSSSQSSSTSAMAASVEQMTVSINTVSTSAGEAKELAQHAGQASTEGGKIIERTTAEMPAIAATVNQASKVIQALGAESEKISSVVQVIKEVADQTNLLALNAAIEAARAGEQGRGFAVVADEVRKLAERTAQSTGDISSLVGKIQISAKEAVGEMNHVVAQVNEGQTLAKDAGARIQTIREEASKVSQAITDISNALQEQSLASQDIAKHVESIAQMTDENNAAAEGAASDARQLDKLSRNVSETVAQFSV